MFFDYLFIQYKTYFIRYSENITDFLSILLLNEFDCKTIKEFHEYYVKECIELQINSKQNLNYYTQR